VSAPAALGQAFLNHGPRGLGRPRYPSRFLEITNVEFIIFK